jgi:DNA-directed RNA polymerase subunit RPC12/RpoP
MSVKFKCPRCLKLISAPDALAGKEALCPTCKSRIPIPPAPGPVNAVPPDGGPAAPTNAAQAGARAVQQRPRRFKQDANIEKKPGVPIWVWAGIGVVVLVVVGVGLIAAIAIPSLHGSRIAANEISACGTMKNLVTSEACWRQNDMDRNGENDYWTGDVSGFYRVLDDAGNCVKIMDIAVAKADNAPLPPDADGVAPDIGASVNGGMPTPKFGYYFQSMITDAEGKAYQTDGPDKDKNAWENPADFGFQANPHAYNSSGINTFIVDGNGVIWKKDQGTASPVLTWPKKDPSFDGWIKVD